MYDTIEGADPTIQLLEYANTQLLEFRYYDAVLTKLLDRVHRLLERGGGLPTRWRLAGEAEHVDAIRLDVRELTERVDNSIKFLSDMFEARLNRMAADKIGVPEYRNGGDHSDYRTGVPVSRHPMSYGEKGAGGSASITLRW